MECPQPEFVLAIDPGRDKCGLALLDPAGQCLRRAVVRRADLIATLREWTQDCLCVAVLGDRTGSQAARTEIAELGLFADIHMVDEHRSTEEARQLYFREQPPRGLKRLIPVGLLSPPEPVDDYAAWILGTRYLKGRSDHE